MLDSYTREEIQIETQKRIKNLSDDALRSTLGIASEIMKICSANENECAKCCGYFICTICDWCLEEIWVELSHRMNERERERMKETWEV